MSDTGIEKARTALAKQVGSLKGSPREVSKEEIWREFMRELIDLA
jgi:hypothetical protein